MGVFPLDIISFPQFILKELLSYNGIYLAVAVAIIFIIIVIKREHKKGV